MTARNLGGMAGVLCAFLLAAESPAQNVSQWTIEGQRLDYVSLGQAAPASDSGAADATAAQLPDGRVRLYFGTSSGSIWSAISSDGLTFSVEPGARVTLPGLARAAGPRVVRLDDGRSRLFYLTGGSSGGIASAISTDGLNFTVEPGFRISASDAGESTLEPGAIVKLPNATYRMYFAGHVVPAGPVQQGYVRSATSTDMLTWVIEPGIRVGVGSGLNNSAVHPFALLNGDGSVTVYFFEGPIAIPNTNPPQQTGLMSFATSADGLTFMSLTRTNIEMGFDPDVVRLPDGRLRMYFGRHSDVTGNSIWSAIITPGTTANVIGGWNLLGNGLGNALTVASVFGDSSLVTTVWKWIASSGAWAFYTPTLSDGGTAYAASKGYSFLTTINAGEGFWVNAKGSFSVQLSGSVVPTSSFADGLTSNALPGGWSLIAIGDDKTPATFANTIAVNPPAAGTSVATSLTTLWAWDATLAGWYFFAPTLVNAGTQANYIASKGYLDFGSKTLSPTTGFWVNKP